LSQTTPDLARVFRAESGRIIASLMMHTHSVDIAEDALHDALLEAAEKWLVNGIPKNQAAWLLTVARRRLIDRFRKESFRNARATLQAVLDTQPDIEEFSESEVAIPDERLRLIFTCCHPALADNVRVPLTLKTLCGFSTLEISRAFLTTETSIIQRLTRAKRKIRDAGIPYQVPEGNALNDRLPSVLSVIYLIYNESYSAFDGHSLTRKNLAEESIRLARILHKLLPRPEVAGLLALLLLHHSRESARSSDAVAFIPLEQQNRKLWKQDLIQEGTKILLIALSKGQPGIYQLQASISGLHAMAENWASTDWPQILQLYSLLLQLNPSPVVSLNKAVALAHSGHVEPAYQTLNELEEDLSSYQPFFAARAQLAEQLGKPQQALNDYDKALSFTKNSAERDFLLRKRQQLIDS